MSPMTRIPSSIAETAEYWRGVKPDAEAMPGRGSIMELVGTR